MKSLYIQQKFFKILDHYPPITDENGQTIYQVDQEFNPIGHTVHVSAPPTGITFLPWTGLY